MANETCMTCFHYNPIMNETDFCVCLKGGGLGRLVESKNISCCKDYENKDEHVYTIEEMAYDLLSFCNDLTDEIVFYSVTDRIPTEEDCTAFSKKYRELADRAKEFDVVL